MPRTRFSDSRMASFIFRLLALSVLAIFRNCEGYSALIVSPKGTSVVPAAVVELSVSAIKSYFDETGSWTVETTAGGDAFEPSPVENIPPSLLKHDVVVFLNFDGQQLSSAQRSTLQNFVSSRKGFVGIGSACPFSSGNWSWYESLVGTSCVPPATGLPVAANNQIIVDDRVHPASYHLPERWTVNDAVFDLAQSPRSSNHVLATAMKASAKPDKSSWDHPVSWCKMFQHGRSFYTSLGLSQEIWSSKQFLKHVGGGIMWSAGQLDGDCNSTLDVYWEKQTVDANVDQPMQLAITPSSDVFFIERTGALKKYVTVESKTLLIGVLNVSTDVEDGLLGIALDPSFETTGWIYLYYSPRAVIQSCLSRFTVQHNQLDLSSEVKYFCVDTQRKECCHSGGSLKYDYPRNLLYLALGDNTSPYGDSDSFAPLDERPGRSFFDSQRTAANTMDLRGKILRIIPYANGTYDAPSDNLFVQGPIRGRKEVFVMGVRNPFRYSINPSTGTLYWAEVGPNSEPNPARGPRGVDEVNMAETAGNYGWPYCIGPNQAYRNWNFADKTSTRNFDCSRPTNLSPNRDKGGSETLPPAREAMIWYGYAASTEFPEITLGITSPKTPGRCAMLGPFYQHLAPSSGLSSATRVLPAYFNNTAFFMEWRREYIMELKMDSTGKLLKLNHLWTSFEWRGPIDMEISPDGWIYVAEYGTDFEGLVRPARITRIRYTTKPRVPECALMASPASGRAPLQVSFSASGSIDPAGLDLVYSWSIPPSRTDAVNFTSSPNTTGSYLEDGLFSAKVTVRNSMGSESTCSVPIVVGNTAPSVLFLFPPFGSVYQWGSKVPYVVFVEDVEDGSSEQGSVDCSKVEVQPQLGHDNHYHSLVSLQGCRGEVQTLMSGHEGDVDIFYALEARYTDNGAGIIPPLTGKNLLILQPQRKQAETFAASDITAQNVRPTLDSDGGFSDVFGLKNRSWICYGRYNLFGITTIRLRAAVYRMSRVDVRLESNVGQLVGSVDLQTTSLNGTQRSFADFTGAILPQQLRLEATRLCLVFVSLSNRGVVADLNWFELLGPGATQLPSGGSPANPAWPPILSPPMRQNPSPLSFSDSSAVLWATYLTLASMVSLLFC